MIVLIKTDVIEKGIFKNLRCKADFEERAIKGLKENLLAVTLRANNPKRLKKALKRALLSFYTESAVIFAEDREINGVLREFIPEAYLKQEFLERNFAAALSFYLKQENKIHNSGSILTDGLPNKMRVIKTACIFIKNITIITKHAQELTEFAEKLLSEYGAPVIITGSALSQQDADIIIAPSLKEALNCKINGQAVVFAPGGSRESGNLINRIVCDYWYKLPAELLEFFSKIPESEYWRAYGELADRGEFEFNKRC